MPELKFYKVRPTKSQIYFLITVEVDIILVGDGTCSMPEWKFSKDRPTEPGQIFIILDK